MNNIITQAGVVLTAMGAYNLVYWVTNARTKRGRDPGQNLFARAHIRWGTTILRLGIVATATGLAVVVVGLVRS